MKKIRELIKKIREIVKIIRKIIKCINGEMENRKHIRRPRNFRGHKEK